MQRLYKNESLNVQEFLQETGFLPPTLNLGLPKRHMFLSGSSRMARLITVYLLNRNVYEISRYISRENH